MDLILEEVKIDNQVGSTFESTDQIDYGEDAARNEYLLFSAAIRRVKRLPKLRDPQEIM